MERVDPNPSDLNGNSFKIGETTINGAIKDHIITKDGRVFYPCQFCNKVFPKRKSRASHLKKCSAKDYILSVDEDNTQPAKTSKIDIQQNIVLNEQMDVSEILSKSSSPPIKITIRRNGLTNGFAVVLKENYQSNEVNNTPSPIKKDESPEPEDIKEEESQETTCRVCTKEFQSPIELLRHSRDCHSYPKVMMALSEVEKFYTVKDRSKCPICNKPLKTNFRSAFVKHLHTHTSETKYSCHVCNKKFRRADHMKAHEKRHIIKDRK